MSERLEGIIFSVILGAVIIGIELFTVWSYTGSMPWNL